MNFHSRLNIDSDRKAEVVLLVMNSIRGEIRGWHGRSYAVATWSIAVLLGVVAYWLKSGNCSDQIFYVIGMLFFAVMSQIYLYFSQIAIKKNGQVLVKCEAALRLTEQDAYIDGKKFFDPSKKGEWVIPVEIRALRWFHLVVALISVAAIVQLKC
jgi:hypothetical protein